MTATVYTFTCPYCGGDTVWADATDGECVNCGREFTSIRELRVTAHLNGRRPGPRDWHAEGWA